MAQGDPPFSILSRLRGLLGRPSAPVRSAPPEQQDPYGALTAMILAIPDPVWLKDREGVYRACNASFEQILGHTARDILGRRDQDFTGPAMAQIFDEQDQGVIDSRQVLVRKEELHFPH